MKAADCPGSNQVPRYFLYGEPPQQPSVRFVHIELIEDRCRTHDWNIAPHVHPDLHHVVLVIEGGLELRMDETNARLRSPCLLVIPAGVVHAMQFQPDTLGYVASIADPLVSVLRSQQHDFAALFEQASLLEVSAEDIAGHHLHASAEALLSELRSSGQTDGILVGAHAQIFLAHCARAVRSLACVASEQQLPARSDGTVNAFRKLIELHFHENWPLQRYADELCISVAHLRATCIKVTGETSIKLLHERIIREAKRHLTFTTRSVAQVAYDLGFTDSAYFSRFFRARTGLTPTDFRNSLRSTRDAGEDSGYRRQGAVA